MPYHKSQLILVLVLGSSLGKFSPALASIPEIKILLGKSLPSVVVEGLDLVREVHGNQDRKQHRGKGAIRFNCLDLSKGQSPFPQEKKGGKEEKLLASISSPSGFISWQNEPYWGQLHIASSKGEHCNLINQVSLESYIKTLLGKEMNSSWPLEALKAQAVAARSYAFYQWQSKNFLRKKGHQIIYDLENSEKDQVSGSFLDETLQTAKATQSTRGEIMANTKGSPVPIFFHAQCGGKTFRPDQVWKNSVEGYASVECPYCQSSDKPFWSYQINALDFKKVFAPPAAVGVFKILKGEDAFPHVDLETHQGVKQIKKSRIREIFGRGRIVSNFFSVQEKFDTIIIKGKGRGHGVGMCQLGALELAKRGWNYQRILSYYFPNYQLKKIY